MKKIINGKRYDTDTAKQVAYWDNGCACSDFDYEAEWLFKKRTGEYFLDGEGGARSRYSVQSYGSWAGGEAITPLTYAEAREWGEAHMDADAYEAEFGPVGEGGENVLVGVRISPAAAAKLDRMAADGETKSAIVERLLMAC